MEQSLESGKVRDTEIDVSVIQMISEEALLILKYWNWKGRNTT